MQIQQIIRRSNSEIQEINRNIVINTDHNVLKNRDLPNQHPISAIEGLQDELNSKAEVTDIPTELSQLNDDTTHRTVTDTEKTSWNDKAEISDIPTELSELNGDSTHRLVTDTEKQEWNNKADRSEIPDVSNFITNATNNLINYYLKSDTYTKTEVNDLIGAIQTVHIEKVQTLPATGEANIIYFVPKEEEEENDVYNEYIWIDNTWELIGTTQIDLTGYATETWVSQQISGFLSQAQIENLINTALASYYNKTQIDGFLNGKQDLIDSEHKLNSSLVDDTNSTNKFVSASEKAQIAGAEQSSNKVTSISSSSTNEQYPSALAVYNYVESLNGNEVAY